MQRQTYSMTVSSKSHRYTDVSISTEDEELVCVLSVGAKFVYVIHEFDALSVELRHIQVKGFTKFGDLEDVFDVFIRNKYFLVLNISFLHGNQRCYNYQGI